MHFILLAVIEDYNYSIFPSNTLANAQSCSSPKCF